MMTRTRAQNGSLIHGIGSEIRPIAPSPRFTMPSVRNMLLNTTE